MNETVAGEVGNWVEEADRAVRGVQWIARSRAMRVLLEQAERAARLQSPVIIIGESGSGKSVLAEYLHMRSARSQGAFVRYRPVSEHANIVEQELFGADNNSGGLIVQSDGGTLYMEDITRFPTDVQPGLLQVLGHSAEAPVNVRIIAATTRSPEEALRAREIQADLYVQLTTIRLEMPALRERSADILGLAELFVSEICTRLERPSMMINSEAMNWLVGNPWPGNVRELFGVLERAIALAPMSATVLGLTDLTTSAFVAPAEHDFLDRAVARRLTIREVEDEYIARVVQVCGDDRPEAARRLGITRRTLGRRLGEWR